MLIEKGYDYIFQGPCTVKKLKGKIMIKGMEIDSQITFNDENYFSIIPIENSEIETNCKPIDKINHLGWEEILTDISRTGGTILLLGKTDSGKTYFSTIAKNMFNTFNIDADVGQSKYFLPTFISSSDLDLEFFGSITPSVNYKLHVQLTLKILEKSKSKMTIIDTDGWISGFKAFLHKLELIDYTNPDYIISFDEKIIDFFPSNIKKKVILVKSVPYFLEKNRNKRILYRKKKYFDYFKNSNDFEVEYEMLFGKRIAENLFLSWNETLQTSPEKPCYGYYICKQDLKGLLVGLVSHRKIVGAGYIKHLGENTVTISTPIKDFDGIILGSVSLNENFEDKKIRFGKC
ncbi:GTPase [Acidianus sulfidivorans JP7]|uniref:polynucleotide 5'-hydroxyl-kinase n=1 Tax=Acidianus sulfidivorans JP7 TaxID=619593 RepID=A0A2U9ILV5_9CREN|nr:Clp1/GlmU family protein [Acidianus sulfidivorans]AWR97049.1 GTPase [Acidianus sulfidivorans JP7]